MTLRELYDSIQGDYDQAIRVMRVEKLVDKHIRKLSKNGTIDALLAAGETMDATQLFETAHAVKGNCANLGLTKISDAASRIAEEFRPGSSRSMSDEEVKEILEQIRELYELSLDGIRRYEE